MVPDSSPTGSKAVFFCAECDHASSIRGDWAVTERRDRRVYECPDCGHTVESRRLRDPVPA